mmetsp:Transcript_30230/g.90663  ORF Transcript_30230/g.90663 Transcript_30230/m.90663 type:complete len:209 (+) Transcript_30230:372-998(+)
MGQPLCRQGPPRVHDDGSPPDQPRLCEPRGVPVRDGKLLVGQPLEAVLLKGHVGWQCPGGTGHRRNLLLNQFLRRPRGEHHQGASAGQEPVSPSDVAGSARAVRRHSTVGADSGGNTILGSHLRRHAVRDGSGDGQRDPGAQGLWAVEEHADGCERRQRRDWSRQQLPAPRAQDDSVGRRHPCDGFCNWRVSATGSARHRQLGLYPRR